MAKVPTETTFTTECTGILVRVEREEFTGATRMYIGNTCVATRPDQAKKLIDALLTASLHLRAEGK